MGAFAVAGLMGASGIMSAMGAMQQAKQQAKMAEYNAQVSRQEAQAIQRKAEYDIYAQRKKAIALRSTQQALYSKAGVLLQGSPLDVINDSWANMEIDTMLTDYNAKVAMTQKEAEARLSEYEARQMRATGMFKAGTTLLTTGLNIGMSYGGLGTQKIPSSTPTTPGYQAGYKLSPSEMSQVTKSAYYY